MKLLEMNNVKAFHGIYYGRVAMLWKHKKPHDTLKVLAKRVVNIFIIRSLDSWLVSMYKNPYYLEPEKCCFDCFLNKEQKSTIEMYDPNSLIAINDDDNDKTIFDIRYSKIKSYFEYRKKHNDIVFVSLEYLQNNKNCEKFLKDLNQKYNLNIKNFVYEFPIHTKSGLKNIKNREYNITIGPKSRAIIDRFKNDKIEDWVNNLTFEMS